MTPQEQQLIDGLIQRVNQTNVTDKDPEAEQYLQQGFRSNPNALYILAQTVLVQQYALEQAQKQLADLRQQQQQPQQQKHGGFLSSIFGSSDPEPQRPSAPPPPQQGQPSYQPVPTQGYAPQQPQYAQPAPMGGGFGQGGFLRGAAQTAAGVAAGALAFEGVESLLHGFGNSMVGGGERGFESGAPREEIVNNYYGDSGRNDDNQNFADTRDDNGNNDPSNNIFTDSNDTGSDADTGNFGDSDNFDDSGSGLDDSSSFDDGASFGSDDNNSF